MNWENIGGEADTAELAAGGDQLFQRHKTGRVFEWGKSGTAWRELDANARTAQIAWDGSLLYQRHKTGMVLEYTGPPFTGWRTLDDIPETIDIVAESGSIFLRHKSGLVWKYLRSANPPHWTNLGGKAGTVQFEAARTESLAPPGSSPPIHLYERLQDGRILKYSGTPQNWPEIDNNRETVQIAATGTSLYKRHGNGRIFEYQNTPGSWREIGNNPQSTQLVAGGGMLYVLLTTGRVHQYNGQPHKWRQLADDSPTASITAARVSGALYKRHHDGSVWIFRDDPVHLG